MSLRRVEIGELKPAVDPYLCHWTEWHYLVLLSWIYLEDTIGTGLMELVQVEGTQEIEVILRNGAVHVLRMEDGQEVRSKIGVGTGLVVRSQSEALPVGMVVTPSEGGWTTGRPLTMFTDFSGMFAPLMATKDRYLIAQLNIVDQAMQRMGCTTYPELYQRLLQSLQERLFPKEEVTTTV